MNQLRRKTLSYMNAEIEGNCIYEKRRIREANEYEERV